MVQWLPRETEEIYSQVLQHRELSQLARDVADEAIIVKGSVGATPPVKSQG